VVRCIYPYELIDFIAASANHEANRRRQKRLEAAFDVLTETLEAEESEGAFTMVLEVADQTTETQRGDGDVTGRWRIVEMDLWDRDALDLVRTGLHRVRP
jgi:hypothetical protein